MPQASRASKNEIYRKLGKHSEMTKMPGHSSMTKAQKKAMEHSDKPGEGAKKRKHLKGQAKVGVVMAEYKKGTLRSGGGEKVKSRKQAIAIGLSEAGLSRKKKK